MITVLGKANAEGALGDKGSYVHRGLTACWELFEHLTCSILFNLHGK